MKRRQGFTLIETLISLFLAVFLLLVVWRMFDVYTKIEDKGVRVVQKVAVVRAVQRQLRSDLRRLVHIDPTQPAPTQFGNPDQSVYPNNGYLFGTSTELSFVTVGSEDLGIQSVVSYMPQRRNENGQREFLQKDDSGDEPVTGVLRVEQSWSAFQRGRTGAENDFNRFNAGREIDLQEDDFLVIGQSQASRNAGEPKAMKSEVRDLIPEIESWRFRYFDRQWQDSWDSGWHRRLPTAIEVSFDMTESESQENVQETEVVFSSEERRTQHRFVISLGINSSFTLREMP
jgi:type II secretory pathway pseudopilin PulG